MVLVQCHIWNNPETSSFFQLLLELNQTETGKNLMWIGTGNKKLFENIYKWRPEPQGPDCRTWFLFAACSVSDPDLMFSLESVYVSFLFDGDHFLDLSCFQPFSKSRNWISSHKTLDLQWYCEFGLWPPYLLLLVACFGFAHFL